MRLRGKSVMVTVGSGIRRAISLEFAKEGRRLPSLI